MNDMMPGRRIHNLDDAQRVADELIAESLEASRAFWNRTSNIVDRDLLLYQVGYLERTVRTLCEELACKR